MSSTQTQSQNVEMTCTKWLTRWGFANSVRAIAISDASRPSAIGDQEADQTGNRYSRLEVNEVRTSHGKNRLRI